MSEALNAVHGKVLIASANPLFAEGLRKLYAERWQSVDLRMTSGMAETLAQMDEWQPDLVIVDYDDKTMYRDEFLNHFIAGSHAMQVLLVSLQESGEAVVYDRRRLTPEQADDWLNLKYGQKEPAGLTQAPEAGQMAEAHTNGQLGVMQPDQAGGAGLGQDMKKPNHFLKSNIRHFVIVGIMFVGLTALTYLGMRAIGLLPEAAAVQAQTIDQLFEAHFFMIALLFSLIFSFLIYSMFAFRGKPGDRSAGASFKANTKLEVVWTAIPLVTVITFSFFGARNLAESRRVDPEAMTVRVVASQWAWLFEYPDYGVRSTELYLPVDQQVLLRLTSRDVIHSFWVPEFRIKQDALPGENLVKEMRITPITIGNYTVMCAEMCGGAHADMNAPVRVVSQADFEKWISGMVGKSVEDPLERGKIYIETTDCLVCHSIDGTRLNGPSFLGLAGSPVELNNGEVVTADSDYLYASVISPNNQIVKGYAPNVHPSDYADLLTDEQVKDMVLFIESLK